MCMIIFLSFISTNSSILSSKSSTVSIAEYYVSYFLFLNMFLIVLCSSAKKLAFGFENIIDLALIA